jgi:hypothetical protein
VSQFFQSVSQFFFFYLVGSKIWLHGGGGNSGSRGGSTFSVSAAIVSAA